MATRIDITHATTFADVVRNLGDRGGDHHVRFQQGGEKGVDRLYTSRKLSLTSVKAFFGFTGALQARNAKREAGMIGLKDLINRSYGAGMAERALATMNMADAKVIKASELRGLLGELQRLSAEANAPRGEPGQPDSHLGGAAEHGVVQEGASGDFVMPRAEGLQVVPAAGVLVGSVDVEWAAEGGPIDSDDLSELEAFAARDALESQEAPQNASRRDGLGIQEQYQVPGADLEHASFENAKEPEALRGNPGPDFVRQSAGASKVQQPSAFASSAQATLRQAMDIITKAHATGTMEAGELASLRDLIPSLGVGVSPLTDTWADELGGLSGSGESKVPFQNFLCDAMRDAFDGFKGSLEQQGIAQNSQHGRMLQKIETTVHAWIENYVPFTVFESKISDLQKRMSEASKELNRDIKEHKGILSRLETNEKRFKDLEIVRNRLETRLQAAQEAHAIVEQALIDVDEEMEAKLIANPGGAEELKLRLNITELESQVQTMEEELTALQAKFQEEGFDKIDEVIKFLVDNRESKVAAGESTSGEDRALAEMDERQSEAEQILSRAQQLIELIDGSKLEIQNLSKGLEATQRHDEVARAEVKQLATLNDKRSADLTAARENLTQVKQEYDSAKSEVDRVKAAVETDERTLAELSEAIQGHQQKVTGLESTLTRQKEALAPISQKLERNFNDMLREMTMLQNSVQ